MNKYLKFEYWNTCDLGNIYYQGGQHFWFFLDGDILEPFHEEIEDGQENGDGDFIPTFRRGMKRYKIRTGLVPEYLVDAIERMKLHDHIELTFKTGEIEQIYNVDVEPEWQFEKMRHQATVVLTFDMDEKIVVGACCDNLTVSTGEEEPEEEIPEIYWIATNGDDNSGNGTYTSPWKTLAYAATQATVVGDIIHVKAGIYYETQQTVLAVGVSILGAGDTSIIHMTYVSPSFSGGLNTGAITLSSATENTNGNQSISYLRLEGDLTSTNAIMVKNRGNVHIHHCHIRQFLWNGITFSNSPNVITPPTTRAVGNKIYNCTIDDCTDKAGTWAGGQLIQFTGQDGLEVYNNLLYADKRPQGYNGDIMSATGQGFSRRIKYYNNKSYKPDYDGDAWNFHLEMFNCYGGNEIYDNEFYGGDCIIDITGMYENTAGDDTYSYRIYNNYFTGTPVQTLHGKLCIDIEGELNEDIYIFNNHFYKIVTPLHFTDNTYGPSETRRVYFYYNILSKIGWNNAAKYTTCMDFYNTDAGSVLEDIYVLNNVIESDGVTHSALKIDNDGAINNLQIKNNIILSHTNGAWLLIDRSGAMDALEIENNLMYLNSNSNLVLVQAGDTGTNYVNQNNVINDNPDFVGALDYHLAAGSPCINAGIAAGLAFITTDYDGVAVSNPPETGAYEF